MKIKLEKGTTRLSIAIPDDKVFDIIMGKNVSGIGHDKIKQIISAENILPGIAGYDSIQQNHSLAMKKDGSAHPMVRQANLWGNPINEDINEAADLFLKNKTCTYVAIAANGTGDIFHVDVGPLHKTFMNGCKKLAINFNMPSYVAFRVIDILKRFNITLVSDLGKVRTRSLGFQYSDQIETYVQDLKGKGYIIPFAENILPLVKA